MNKDEKIKEILRDIWIDGYEVGYYADDKEPEERDIEEWLEDLKVKLFSTKMEDLF